MALESTLRKVVDQPEPSYRQAPHNVEAEQALLGAILINNEAFYRVSDFLEQRHFFEPIHAKIYEVAASIIRAGKIATPVTLKTFLPPDADIAGLSPTQYLARIAADATTIINAEDYGRTIYDLAMRRDLIQIGEEMVNVAYDAAVDFAPRAQIEEAERRLYELVEIGKINRGFLKFAEASKLAVDLASKAYQRDGGISGLATGFKDLDTLLAGLQSSDLIIVAGRPAMGKTAFATNIAYHIASNYSGRSRSDGTIETVQGGIVGFFSLEMSADQLATRIISSEALVPSTKIRHGDINESEFSKLAAAAQDMQLVPLYIDDTGGISVGQLSSRARRLKRQRGLDFLVIDYLQLLTGSTRRALENRVQEVTEITTSLKALAKELNIPILALSQLSRQVEGRDDKRPQLSDLRESGSIEQDADVVIFLYREEYYLQGREPKNADEKEKYYQALQNSRGKADAIVAKHRHGAVDTIRLAFDAEFTSFKDFIDESRVPERRG
jgi:replicative DNA helicase